jgi:predicted nucleic acid-binding protein
VSEPGSADASRIWSSARLVVSSRLLYPEARAALAGAARAGRVSARRLPSARRELEDLWQDVACVEVARSLAARAGELAETYCLRGYDGVHLASVLEIDSIDTVLATADQGLARAAQALGVTTARLPV